MSVNTSEEIDRSRHGSAEGPIRRALREVLFSHVTPLIRLGRTRPLTQADMPIAPPDFDPRMARPAFLSLDLSGPWRFLFATLQAIRGRAALLIGYVALIVIFDLLGPLLIYDLVKFVTGAATGMAPLSTGISVAVLLCLVAALRAILTQHYFYRGLGAEQMIVNGLNMAIFRHALKLTRPALLKTPTGDIVNFMGTDSDAVGEIVFTGAEVVSATLLISGASVLLVWFLGPAGLAALVVLAALAPVTRLVGRKFNSIDKDLMSARDDRVSMVSQVLAGIRIVKYFAWGEAMLVAISKIRAREIAARTRLALAVGGSILIYVGVGTVVCVATFGTYIALGNTLDAATIFSCLALFGILEGPFGHLTELISNVAAARVSADRLRKFLGEGAGAGDERPASPAGQAVGFSFRNAALRHGDADVDTLTDVTLEVRPGEAVAIVGPVGSGKSTILLSLLGEVGVAGGQLSFSGCSDQEAPRAAFVPQEAFIMNGSLHENILFGVPEASVHVSPDAALRAAALSEDVAALPAGLATEIGEHGVNLSGGQKQRVALARAACSGPGLVLLDDPLSAVDFRTEDALVRDLLFGLWRNVTRVVVTHRLAHLSRFDRVVFVEGGRVVAAGPHAELAARSPRYAQFVAEVRSAQGAEPHVESARATEVARVRDGERTQVGRITSDEDREAGAVRADVYFKYLRAMGGETRLGRQLIVPVLTVSTLLVTILPILQNAWLSAWTDANVEGKVGAANTLVPWFTQFVGSDTHNIVIFGVLGFIVLLAVMARHLFWALRAVAAGKFLHDHALTAVMGTTLRFFDSTPVGRILNRFSRDVDAVERELAWSVESCVRSVFAVIGSIIVMLLVLPALILVVLPVLALYFRYQADYRASSREAQRLHSITRSPRFAHFKETLTGLSVIRAFRRAPVFLERYLAVLGENQRMFNALVVLNRWFSIRIPLLGAVVSLGVTIGIIWFARSGAVLAGTAGLAIIYASRFWENLNWSVRAFSQVEAKMTAVERLSAFAAMPAEERTRAEPILAAAEAWPTRGEIVFEDVWARYDQHLPDVLRGVSFRIPEGAKAGFVGRTGAGKTTVFQVLYRFIPAGKGRVLIDGVDIARVPLDRLRRSIAIIPQDPTLFRGSLRSNLDRFDQHDDASVWRALEQAHMADFVRSLPGQLDAEVKENGHNFSQGQRQLFCMARALLIDARIIVMDEATASVDVETDRLIQETIRSAFVGRTLLVIAHRLETLSESDLVVDMMQGKVAAITSPSARPSVSR